MAVRCSPTRGLGVRADEHQFDNAGHRPSVPKSPEQHGNLTREYKKPPVGGGLEV